MHNNPQHWQARTPWRVLVLGLLFVLMVLVLLGLLWLHWQQNIWSYGVLAVAVFASALYTSWRAVLRTPKHTLCFESLSGEFSLMTCKDKSVPIRILHVWQSVFAITLQVRIAHSNEIKQLTFWRSTLSVSSWRGLRTYIWRYQLQYQFADPKGVQ